MAEKRKLQSPLFVLRTYAPNDFQRLWEVDQQCFVRGIAYSQRELAYYIGMRGAFTLVAEPLAGHAGREGKRPIVGFVVGQKLPRGVGHVVTVDVLPEARRSGLGSLLMDECEARLRQDGCRSVYLETAVDNEVALRFYKRLGYAVLKTIPRYYLASVDAFLLGKHL